MARMLAMFEDKDPQVLKPLGPLLLVQAADSLRVLATRSFLRDATNDEDKNEKDMVGDGTDFLRAEVKHAIGELRSEHSERLSMIARNFIASEVVKDIRGALDLCLLTAMGDMDGSD